MGRNKGHLLPREMKTLTLKVVARSSTLHDSVQLVLCGGEGMKVEVG